MNSDFPLLRGRRDVMKDERPRQNKRVQERALQYFLPPEVRRRIKILTTDLGEDVERERVMTYGPMTGYIMRWFLTLPRARQLEIVLAGRELEMAEKKPGEKPSGPAPEVGNPGHARGLGGKKLPKRQRKDAAAIANDGPVRTKGFRE